MKRKSFDDLSASEIMLLKRAVKRVKKGKPITVEEKTMYKLYNKEYNAVIGAASKKKPFYIAAIIIMVLAILIDVF